MNLLAHGATLGIDPTRLLEADPVERTLLGKIIQEARQVQDKRDERLARQVIIALGEAMGAK